MAFFLGAIVQEKPARLEWEAWQVVCREFRKRGLEPNEARNDGLIQALEVWGERLVTLRHEQSDEVRQGALERSLLLAQDLAPYRYNEPCPDPSSTLNANKPATTKRGRKRSSN